MKYLKAFENNFKPPVNILTSIKEILTYELESNDYSVNSISVGFVRMDDISFGVDISFEESEIRQLFNNYKVATDEYDSGELGDTALETAYKASGKVLETKIFEYTYKIFKRLELKHDWYILTFKSNILNEANFEANVYVELGTSYMKK